MIHRLSGQSLVRAGRWAAAVVLMAAGTELAVARLVHADTAPGNQNTYQVSAEGDGAFVVLDDGSLPLVSQVAFGPYTAQATTSSLGGSSGFAGFPYAGPIFQSISGTVNGVGAGKVPPLPPLPGYVTSSYPATPNGSQSLGPYVLSSQSTQQSATSQAGFGLSAGTNNQPQIFSTAKTVANDDGSVTATATAGIDAINLGPIDLLNISSTAKITEQGSKDPTVSVSTDMGTITVAGIKVGVDQGGLKILGANLGLPVAQALQLINNVLGQGGLTMKFLPSVTTYAPGSKTVQSVTSAALEVSETRVIPSQGKVTVSYTFGRTTVSATNAASAGDTGGSAAGSSSGSSASPGTGAATGGDTTPALGTGGATPGGPVSASPASAGGAGETPPALASTPGSPAASPPLLAGRPKGGGSARQALGGLRSGSNKTTSGEGFYLILVLAGLVALGSSQGVRLLTGRQA
jgi:hypothetical protein